MSHDVCPECGKLLVHFDGYSLCMGCFSQNLMKGMPEYDMHIKPEEDFTGGPIHIELSNEKHCLRCFSTTNRLLNSGLCRECSFKQARQDIRTAMEKMNLMPPPFFPGLRAMAMGKGYTRVFQTLMPHTPKQFRSACE